jgi:hypothetical protein
MNPESATGSARPARRNETYNVSPTGVHASGVPGGIVTRRRTVAGA